MSYLFAKEEKLMVNMSNETNKVRKSSFELLRILAMLMIVADHYVLQNGAKVSDIQGGLVRLIHLYCILSSLYQGKLV